MVLMKHNLKSITGLSQSQSPSSQAPTASAAATTTTTIEEKAESISSNSTKSTKNKKKKNFRLKAIFSGSLSPTGSHQRKPTTRSIAHGPHNILRELSASFSRTEDEEELSSSVVSADYDPYVVLESCLSLLSANAIHDNQVALEKLLNIFQNTDFASSIPKSSNASTCTASTSGNTSLASADTNTRDIVARLIVYDRISSETKDKVPGIELLPNLLLHFLCNVREIAKGSSRRKNKIVVFSEGRDDYDSDEDDDIVPRGKEKGSLHLLALQFLSNCLEHVLNDDPDLDILESTTIPSTSPNKSKSATSSSSATTTTTTSIPFKGIFWANIVDTLIYNIELCVQLPTWNKITGYSLKCFRLLHSLEPVLMKQMLQQSLMPYIIHLKGYGEQEKLPMIESEASRLLKRAEIQATKYITI